ncbi:Hypothetical Protein FCC1311_113032, partial [Hondaea fermentalgiana]
STKRGATPRSRAPSTSAARRARTMTGASTTSFRTLTRCTCRRALTLRTVTGAASCTRRTWTRTRRRRRPCATGSDRR